MSDKRIIQALQMFPYGLFVVASAWEEKSSAIVLNWATQVSFYPPLVAIAVEADSRVRPLVEGSNLFSINVLDSGSKDIARALLKKANAPLSRTADGVSFGQLGTPILDAALASLECTVAEHHRVGDHVLFIGEVRNAVIRKEGEVLTLKETGWKYKGSAKEK